MDTPACYARENAIEYAVKDWRVFPIPPNEKKSYIASKQKTGIRWGQSNDPGEVSRMFRRYKRGGIGLPTGTEQGFFVVETDVAGAGHAHNGAESLAELIDKHGALPETLMARSPSGSIHYYFRHPGRKVWCSAGVIGPGIDCKGDNGMVVAPPTIRDDGAYTWVNEGTAIAEAPAWLINLVTARPKANGSDATNAFEAYGEQAPKLGPRLTRDDAIAVLEDMQHGTIHASQLKATAILFNNGVGDDEIVETILRSERELSDTDGWDWGEEERTIRADLAEQHKERKAKEKVAEAKVAEAKVVRFADVVDLEDVTAQNLDYIWPNRTAIGKHTGIAGPGGGGKSQLLYDMASRISNGAEWPADEGKAPQGSVLILSAEDDVADMMVPRLVAAGANLKYVKAIAAVNDGDGRKNRFNLIRDLDTLNKICRERGDVVMIGIDPLGSYLGADLDTHRDAALRSALDPISEVASFAKVAIVSIMHFNKAANKSAMDRVMGGAGFVNAPRCSLGWLTDPEDKSRRLLLPIKTNMHVPQGLIAHIEEGHAGYDNRRAQRVEIRAPHIVWDGVTEMTANAVMTHEREREAPRTEEANAFLRAELKDGARPVAEVKAHANALGITAITLRRAIEDMCVVSRQIKGKKHGGWEYFLGKLRTQKASTDDDQEASLDHQEPMAMSK